MTLIHDFIFVPLGKESVARLLDAGSSWLGPLASGAVDDGERLLVRLGPFGSLATFGKTVAVNAGPPVQRGNVTLVPITWHATGTPHLFPAMTADLEIAPLGTDLTQITLQGHYEPPLGAAGRGLDRLVLHRIAHATVRSFLHRIVAAMVTPDDPDEPAEPWRRLLGSSGGALAQE